MGDKLDNRIDPIPGDYVWDKMTGKKYVVVEAGTKPQYWSIYDGGGTNTIHQSCLSSSVPESFVPLLKRWYFLWLF